jgi:ADP-ribose pyrophosphatase
MTDDRGAREDARAREDTLPGEDTRPGADTRPGDVAQPGEDARLREKTAAERVVFQGRYLTFRVDTIVDPEGHEHEREIVLHPGAVAIVALDGEDVLLVRQWRHATGGALLEIPAGTVDILDDGTPEEPAVCAVRELGEETGRQAARWTELGAFWTAPGFTDEHMHLYLARDLSPAVGSRGPDPGERLELVRMPWREAVAMAERGEIHDAKSIVGLLRLARLADRGAL